MAEPGFLCRRAAPTLPRETALGLPVRTGPALAALVAPYRHPKLSAVKLAGDPINPARFKDDATADALRAEIMKRLTALSEAGVLDLEALPVGPEDGIGNRSVPSVDQSGMIGK